MQRSAVARRLLGHPVGGLQADRTRHVGRNNGRLARDMAAHVARDQAGAQVVVAPGRGRDHHPDGLAAIEVGNRLGRCGR
jgi:hypothetical protein